MIHWNKPNYLLGRTRDSEKQRKEKGPLFSFKEIFLGYPDDDWKIKGMIKESTVSSFSHHCHLVLRKGLPRLGRFYWPKCFESKWTWSYVLIGLLCQKIILVVKNGGCVTGASAVTIVGVGNTVVGLSTSFSYEDSDLRVRVRLCSSVLLPFTNHCVPI